MNAAIQHFYHIARLEGFAAVDAIRWARRMVRWEARVLAEG